MSLKTLNLNPKLYEYLLSVSLHEHEILKELREKTAELPSAKMQIAPEQGQLMAMIAKLMNAKNALEIGVFTGYSSLSVAMALPPDGKLIACDVSDTWTSIAKTFWEKAGVINKIELKIAPAANTLDDLIQKVGEKKQDLFDFIFIDADKENYALYYDKSFELLRSGGLILIDNTLWDGDVADETINDNSTRAIREFNQKLFRDKRIQLSLVPIGDGLTLARKI